MKDKKKSHFVNTFQNPSWMGRKRTPKVSSLFTIEKIYTRVKENDNVTITIKLSNNRTVVKYMLTDDDYLKICKGVYFTGKSKLHEGDIWNEQLGTDIAEHRAMEKAYHFIHLMLCNKYKEMQLQLTSIMHINQKFMDKRDKQYVCANKLGGK